MGCIRFSKVTSRDIKLYEQWDNVNCEYLHEGYGNKNNWLGWFIHRDDNYSYYVVKYDNVIIGFCQYYDCFHSNEEGLKNDEKNQTYSLDYIIAEENYINKGYGKEIIKKLITRIKKKNGKRIIVKAEKKNLLAQENLLATGFLLEKGAIYYRTI